MSRISWRTVLLVAYMLVGFVTFSGVVNYWTRTSLVPGWPPRSQAVATVIVLGVSCYGLLVVFLGLLAGLLVAVGRPFVPRSAFERHLQEPGIWPVPSLVAWLLTVLYPPRAAELPPNN